MANRLERNLRPLPKREELRIDEVAADLGRIELEGPLDILLTILPFDAARGFGAVPW